MLYNIKTMRIKYKTIKYMLKLIHFVYQQFVLMINNHSF